MSSVHPPADAGDIGGALSQAEPEPPVAAQLFGAQIEIARRFTADLSRLGEKLGLIGPTEPSRIWSRHVVNSALIAPLIRANARVLDVGSGAGLPGLVLAIARPDATFQLMEPMERRVDWLRAEIDRLELSNVTVHRARADGTPQGFAADQLTARAVSSLSKLLPLVAPLVRPGGELLLMKGASVDAEQSTAAAIIRRLGLVDVEVLTLGLEAEQDPTRVFSAVVPS